MENNTCVPGEKEQNDIQHRVAIANSLFGVLANEMTIEEAKIDRAERIRT